MSRARARAVSAPRLTHAARSIGDSIDARGPVGRYTYSKQHDAMVMIGAGSGLTPLLQVAQAVAEDAEDATPIVLLMQNREERDIMLRDRLERLEREHDNITVRFFCSRAGDAFEDEAAGTFAGYVDQQRLQHCVEEAGVDAADTGTQAFICGPSGFAGAMSELLQQVGVAEDRVHVF